MTQQNPSPNRYTFMNDDETMKVVYYPTAPGPILQGQVVGPRVDYQGQGGNRTFDSSQVETLQSPLGQLITVTIEPSIDAGVTTLTILVPPINLAEQESQMFETYGIETRSYGILIKTGARLTYNVFELDGLAENVILPY